MSGIYNNGNELPVVVGIGASAGGLEAIQEFFDRMEGDCGAAFVVVQHLSPDFKSLMDEILRRHTGMQVVKVEGRTTIRPNCVYLLPARSDLLVDGDSLDLKGQPADVVPRPIDVFFCSLAKQHGDAAIAIVLSGTGSDGARGVREIKAAGGMVLVQDPDSAMFDGMPDAAIATGCTDFVLPAAELAKRVMALLKHPYLRSAAQGFIDEMKADKGPYEAILETLTERLDCDLTAYKPGTLVRRIERRMSLHHIREPEDYLALLHDDREEVSQLAKDCLINVTRFFRDSEAFSALERQLATRLVNDQGSDPFRIWVAGCASGEEAYSIAAIVEQLIERTGKKRDFKVFATDISDAVLEIASSGLYPLSIADEIPAGYVDRLGSRTESSFRITTSLRNRIVFARHDVLRDPPFPRADLVTCRNLLIYLKPHAQQAALDRFNFALRPDGLLFLGSSESVDSFEGEFDAIDPKNRIYSKRPGSRPLPALARTSRPLKVGAKSDSVANRAVPVDESAVGRACERLVDLFAEAGAVVDDAGHLLYSFGGIEEWLRVPRGRVSTNLFDMLPENAVESTRWALRQARHTEEAVHVGRITVDGSERSLQLVHVVGDDRIPALDVLLLTSAEASPVATAAATQDLDLDTAVQQQIDSLESDLQSTRASLQTTIEELETANEELQSTNEELLASNEELQSTNEELHSVNEELFTVNSEHEQKIAELMEVTADLEHLLDTSEIGTVFLDGELRVRRFTPSATIAIPLSDQDRGRPITVFRSEVVDVDFADLARRVLETGEPELRRGRTEGGAHLDLRLLPYRSRSDRISGVVITIMDITRAEEAQRSTLEQAKVLRSIEETSSDVFWMVDAETLRLRYLSPSYERIWGQPAKERLAGPTAWLCSLHPDDRTRVEREYFDKIRESSFEIRYRIVRPDGQVRWIHDRSHGVIEEDGQEVIVGSAEDVTSSMQLDEQHRRSLEVHRKACDRALVPMLLVRRDSSILWVNAAARREIIGDELVLPRDVREVFPSETCRNLWDQALERVQESKSEVITLSMDLRSGGSRPCEVELVYADEEPDQPGSDFVVCQWVDLTDRIEREHELASKAADLEQEADHDALTGLLNRRGLERELGRQLQLNGRSGDPTVVLLIDCDRFKQVNDQFGHAAGDATLQEIARRLRTSLRPSDIVARVGGDEFLAVLPRARLAEGAHVGEKLRRAVANSPVRYRGRDLKVTVSIGVVTAPTSTMSAQELIGKAGSMLGQSKRHGRDRVSFAHRPASADSIPGDGLLESLLAGNVAVVAQSFHDVRTSNAVGFELFTRGTGPLTEPDRFFDASRQANCLERLDTVCLDQCVRHAESLDAPRIHVNVFPSTLLAPRSDRIDAILDGVRDKERLCLELSEQQFVGASTKLRSRIECFRDKGIRIALDDVGFGHTALETLIAIEPDVVKIDRALVCDIDQTDRARRQLARVVGLLQNSGVELIAEGVEREGQRQVLEDLGVPIAQGFLWSRPGSVEEAESISASAETSG